MKILKSILSFKIMPINFYAKWYAWKSPGACLAVNRACNNDSIISGAYTCDQFWSLRNVCSLRKVNEEKKYMRKKITFSLTSISKVPLLIMLSRARSAICSKLLASMSSITVPFSRRLRSSKSECSDRVATWGLLHLLPPSSTSSSNFIHLREKFFVYFLL